MSKKKKSGDYMNNLMKRSDDARTVRKIVAVIVVSLVLILVVGGVSGYMYIKSALEPVDPDSNKEVKVEIPMGSSTSAIAQILEQKGIIKDARVFRFYIKFNNKSNFQAGEYTLSPSMEIDQIIEALKNGKVLEKPIYRVTIPEGKTIEEIAEIYAKKLPFSKKEFLDVVNDPEYVETLINTYPDILTNVILDPDIRTPLEGYLFAATYNIYEKDPTVKAVVRKMLEKTVAVVTPYLDEISARDFTVHEALTMASLVENESSSEKQRRKIASVFYNRLEIGMPLQTDPTVLYALGKHKEKLYYKDLDVQSPYNTYVVDKLPIGPISNFAEISLQAVINPQETEYKYFLHDDKGNIYFAKTLKEHRALKQKYIN